jgi:hypothetical protein
MLNQPAVLTADGFLENPLQHCKTNPGSSLFYENLFQALFYLNKSVSIFKNAEKLFP